MFVKIRCSCNLSAIQRNGGFNDIEVCLPLIFATNVVVKLGWTGGSILCCPQAGFPNSLACATILMAQDGAPTIMTVCHESGRKNRIKILFSKRKCQLIF